MRPDFCISRWVDLPADWWRPRAPAAILGRRGRNVDGEGDVVVMVVTGDSPMRPVDGVTQRPPPGRDMCRGASAAVRPGPSGNVGAER